MKNLIPSLLVLCCMTPALANESSTKTHQTDKHHAAHWGYTGAAAPIHWASMSEKFRLCGNGKNQSPININNDFDVNLPTIAFDYAGKARRISNNGHTIQVNIGKNSQMSVEGDFFQLKQFHFHSPSENTINGQSFPLEAHFVHRSHASKTYAVIAVMFEEGAENPILKQIWDKMPEQARDRHELNEALAYSQLMPDDKDYYRFNGSFTTPPCTEGVKWFVLKKTMTASKAQIDQFKAVMHRNNNRPVQPVGARVILD